MILLQPMQRGCFLFFVILALVSCSNPYASFIEEKGLSEGIFAEMQTNKGSVFFELDYKKRPSDVAHFLTLATARDQDKFLDTVGLGLYDTVVINRSITDLGFVFQGKKSSPSRNYNLKNGVNHRNEGVIGFYSIDGKSVSNTLYVTYTTAVHLNEEQKGFGAVIDGLKTLEKLNELDTVFGFGVFRLGKEAKEFDALSTLN